MPKRQLILLVLMGIAVLYGAYTLLVGDETDSALAPAKDYSELLATVRSAADVNALSAVEAHRIALLETGESSDPLLKRDPASTEGVAAARQGDERFVYSGFISLGSARFAVINDAEYAEGEMAGDTGYMLLAIHPDYITLQGRDMENGQVDKVSIPIQEDIITFVEDTNAEDSDEQ